MKYLHEKMLDVQSNGNSLEFSKNVPNEPVIDIQKRFPTYDFHPCIMCLVILVFLVAVL